MYLKYVYMEQYILYTIRVYTVALLHHILANQLSIVNIQGYFIVNIFDYYANYEFQSQYY